MISKHENRIAFLMVLGLACVASAVMAQDKVAETPTSTITLVEVPARRIAFVEHIGPYWKLGKAIDDTRAHMASEHRTSPLIIRYATDPGRTQPQQLKVEVGYVLSDGDKPSAPFAIRTEPASTSIALTINEPTVSPRTAYAQLKQWAKVHDLTPVGPMTELHITTEGQGSAAPATTLEFQMPLVSSGSTALATKSELPTNTIARPRSAHEAKAIDKDPVEGYFDSRVSIINEANKSAKANDRETLPTSEPSHPSMPTVETTIDASLSDDADANALSVQTIGGMKTNETARAKARGSGEQLGESSDALSEAPIDESNQSIESLFAAGEYDKLALSLMPERTGQSNTTIVWLGQLSFRISAAAKGIQDQYPDDAEPLLQLSQALRDRHLQLSSMRSLDTLQHATVQVDAENKSTRTRLAQIMRRIDRLLAGIAFKQLSPDEVNGEIVNILTQANELFSAIAP